MNEENINVNVDTSYYSKVRRKFFSETLALTYDAIIYIGGSIFMQTDDWEDLYIRRKRIVNSW